MNMRRGVPVAAQAALILTALAAGPVAAQEEHQIMADIRILQMQTQELHVLVSGLALALADVTSQVDEQAAMNRKAFADSRLLVDTVADGIRILREKVDDTNVRISSFSQEVEALRLSIPRMPMPVMGDAGEDGGEAQVAIAPPVAQPANPGISPQRLYEMAWADYSTGQWSLAITGFDTYIKTFPRSDLADDAQFYIGETLYNDGRFADAVGAYDQAMGTYPTGDIVPEAQYKRGLALDRLGDTEQARQAFQTIVDEFPDSRMAALARQALDRLNRP
jgi:tol-pal system protein YbgF